MVKSERGSGGMPRAAVIALGVSVVLAAFAGPVILIVAVAAVLLIGGFGILLLPLVLFLVIIQGLPLAGIEDLGNADFDDLTQAERSCEETEALLVESNPDSQADRAERIVNGDGKGQLERVTRGSPSGSACTVPNDMLEDMDEAGSVCDVIGPVTIAAQIMYESQFRTDFVGPNGARGVSQVPTEAFERLAEEGADPLDADVSIDVQGRYLCELAGQVQDLVGTGQAAGSVLDMTLAAYDVGIDAVREAKGVPASEDAQSYVVGVRLWFAPMEGVGPPPRKIPLQNGMVDTGPGIPAPPAQEAAPANSPAV
ncbi:lytic transglycosylase domain-containing protein [Streptomyces capillispiralis]|uniref:Transglycosylase-like protein with SLT domain n=1 Tax=Streptomyces capillispiralis TaxID=68182 RepID=A0A561SGW8_9ACTN|nr:lytic transglycosylase domain-containing protein [Streptomyces capillispiralis]TWF74116.1 transglycosylase-like protein with SLT domain [Streptomyces capillispiralis]GHE23977.1 hypothetical protein GCM10017779_70450 [Streptomyces capillispiralis]